MKLKKLNNINILILIILHLVGYVCVGFVLNSLTLVLISLIGFWLCLILLSSIKEV